jgi:glutamate 5-kinase
VSRPAPESASSVRRPDPEGASPESRSGLGGLRRRTVVVKIGSSSVTTDGGAVDRAAVAKLASEVATVRGAGHQVVVVTSGAVAAGRHAMGEAGRRRDPAALQALAAVGQPRLIHAYTEVFADTGLTVGQVLLAPLDFGHRQQYLHARRTLATLLDLDVVPVVNENDATSDDEIRFGDNDRLAALVAHLVAADLLVLLTDTAGLFTADPRSHAEASLIEEVAEVDHALERVAGGAGSDVGSGGMAAKLAAARIASWSGVRTVIADAQRTGVLPAAVEGQGGIGTVFQPRTRRLPARKLWIAFAVAPAGRLVVDDGARRAVCDRDASLLPAGVLAAEGRFDVDDAVEIASADGVVFAKGLARLDAEQVRRWAGRRTAELPVDGGEVVHRDDLVVLA